MCLIYGVVAGFWDLMMGFAGVFSFGSIAFYVIGAYASPMLTNQFGISPWLGIFAAGCIAAGFGVLIGFPCLNLKGGYVALLTFALHLILDPFLKSSLGVAIGTGGPRGIITIPELTLGGYTFSSLEVIPPYYTALCLSFASFIVMYKIIHSNLGLAFGAIRDSESFASSLGINIFKYKLIVFGISSFFTGIIGAFYAHYIGVVSPRLLGLDMFLMVIVMMVLGGQGIFPGAMIGAFIVTFLSEYLRVAGVYRLLIFGILVVVLCTMMPKGIMGIVLPNNKRISSFIQRIFPSKDAKMH
jgi:branched-chain amino acid transport system permease protein